jgi:hypothetical protein
MQVPSPFHRQHPQANRRCSPAVSLRLQRSRTSLGLPQVQGTLARTCGGIRQGKSAYSIQQNCAGLRDRSPTFSCVPLGRGRRNRRGVHQHRADVIPAVQEVIDLSDRAYCRQQARANRTREGLEKQNRRDDFRTAKNRANPLQQPAATGPCPVLHRRQLSLLQKPASKLESVALHDQNGMATTEFWFRARPRRATLLWGGRRGSVHPSE